MAQITEAWLAGYEILLQWAREERERLAKLNGKQDQAVSAEPITARQGADETSVYSAGMCQTRHLTSR